MSIFGDKPSRGTEPAEQGRVAVAPAPTLSIVGAGMTVRGDLESNGVVKIEGLVEGNVTAKSQVLVAKGGVVRGDIETAEAVIGGSVSGAIRGSDRVEVQTGASVDGDITTRRISVAEGGALNGMIRMDEPRSAREEHAAESARGEARPRIPANLRSPLPPAPVALPSHPPAPQSPA